MQLVVDPEGTRPLHLWRRNRSSCSGQSDHRTVVPMSSRMSWRGWWADLSPVHGPRLGPFLRTDRGPPGRKQLAGIQLVVQRSESRRSDEQDVREPFQDSLH